MQGQGTGYDIIESEWYQESDILDYGVGCLVFGITSVSKENEWHWGILVKMIVFQVLGI